MKNVFLKAAWPALVLCGCTDLRSGSVTGADAGTGTTQSMLVVAMSSEEGIVSVGTGAEASEFFFVDGRTQRPVSRARVEVLPQPGGYLVRSSLDEEAYEPEVVFVQRGRRAVVPMEPATAAVRSRVLRPSIALFDQEWLMETDLAGVAAASLAESRPNVVFVPALDPEQDAAQAKFYVYKSALPQTLLAVQSANAQRPANGTIVTSTARSVSSTGVRRAGFPVATAQLSVAGRRRMVDALPAPRMGAVKAVMGAAPGLVSLQWSVADEGQRLQGFAVGVDTTAPEKRLDAQTLALNVQVLHGAHFACVRPVFDGADADNQLQCVAFNMETAPPAPNVRVRVRNVPTAPVVARRPVPVEIEVENTGNAAAPAFDIAVVVSPDGKPTGGLGELRLIHIDGIPAAATTRRSATVTAPRGGSFFVVAQADPTQALIESNAQDNAARAPITVMPTGANHAPVLSLAMPDETAVAAGQPLLLHAFASDQEDGDLSAKIIWTSSIDGLLGQGGALLAGTLSPGVHRVRASVSDVSLPSAAAAANRKLKSASALRSKARLTRAVGDEGVVVVAELIVEVFAPASRLNSPPMVSAGPDLVTLVGNAISPVAAVSDLDGDAVVVGWQAFDPTGAAVPVQMPARVAIGFVPSLPGTYRLVLSVSDSKTISQDEVAITAISPAANRKPELVVLAPGAGTVGMPVAVTVQAMDADADGVTLSFFLARPTNSQTLLANANTMAPSYTPDVPGPYALTVWADDGRGGRVQSVGNTIVAGVPSDNKRENGTACAQATECGSGFCSGGICCGSPCTGSCESCGLAASMGTCTAVPEGVVDPKNICVAQAVSTCGSSGKCDGKGGCASYPVSTVCRAASCTGGVLMPAGACTAVAPMCSTSATVNCMPYTCDAQGVACRSVCTVDADCLAPAKCTQGSCGSANDGVTCTINSQCKSGNCADGVCCNSPCAGACLACNVPGFVGRCSSAAAGTTDASCTMEATASCGFDGTCNGAGACRLWSAATSCATARCMGGAVVSSSSCNGTGMCVAGTSTPCGAYACNDATVQCRTTCTLDAHCGQGYSCVNNVCQNDLIFRFNFDEAAGSTMVVDSSGNGNQGTVKSSTPGTAPAVPGTFTAGRTGGGLSLDGVSQYVHVPDSDSIDRTGITSQFTISAWVYVRGYAASGFNYVVSRQEAGTPYEHFGLALSNGKATGAVHFFYTTGATLISTNQWVHLAVVYDGITQQIYEKGVLASSQDIGWPIAADTTATLIGADENTTAITNHLNATVDDVRLYAWALSAAQVSGLAQ